MISLRSIRSFILRKFVGLVHRGIKIENTYSSTVNAFGMQTFTYAKEKFILKIIFLIHILDISKQIIATGRHSWKKCLQRAYMSWMTKQWTSISNVVLIRLYRIWSRYPGEYINRPWTSTLISKTSAPFFKPTSKMKWLNLCEFVCCSNWSNVSEFLCYGFYYFQFQCFPPWLFRTRCGWFFWSHWFLRCCCRIKQFTKKWLWLKIFP